MSMTFSQFREATVPVMIHAKAHDIKRMLDDEGVDAIAFRFVSTTGERDKYAILWHDTNEEEYCVNFGYITQARFGFEMTVTPVPEFCGSRTEARAFYDDLVS